MIRGTTFEMSCDDLMLNVSHKFRSSTFDELFQAHVTPGLSEKAKKAVQREKSNNIDLQDSDGLKREILISLDGDSISYLLSLISSWLLSLAGLKSFNINVFFSSS
ncbi:unnamed protein product [Eruca vesicaria subsp. sativa]|uniref:Uncharacterized protein n=1 Tax=Eruca vesicaria subsp. sativa TaxID=29727 RepID=A0ABC8JVX7_ERUVS|nr:unnamed protein product [Eruca vesicaria subsp. sativa]